MHFLSCVCKISVQIISDTVCGLLYVQMAEIKFYNIRYTMCCIFIGSKFYRYSYHIYIDILGFFFIYMYQFYLNSVALLLMI